MAPTPPRTSTVGGKPIPCHQAVLTSPVAERAVPGGGHPPWQGRGCELSQAKYARPCAPRVPSTS